MYISSESITTMGNASRKNTLGTFTTSRNITLYALRQETYTIINLV